MNHPPQNTSSMDMVLIPMSDDKKIGVTHAIREKLNFLDERLWKRFLARRLELIDTLDLSSRKASDQEDEIKKVADMLRLEFKYGPEYFPDFDKLVRAAVQSVRRNRKRSTKTRRNNVRKRRLSLENESLIKEENGLMESSGSERGHFLAEISRLNTDSHDDIYDMNYSRQKAFTTHDQSRAAIDSIIQPIINDTKPHLGVLLPPLPNLVANQQMENERELHVIKRALLLLMKRSKLCLESTTHPKNDFLRVLGQSSLASISALVFENSFSSLNQTSIDHLLDKLSQSAFLARFYRSLEESTAANALDDETATITLQTLVGCCIKDFGFDRVLYQLGEAFYRSILVEYPLVLKSSRPFLRSELESQSAEPQNFLTSLTNLATVASELRGQIPAAEDLKKRVVLRFLSSLLEFTYPTKNSAPPRFVELMENAKLAFKLNENQIFGLRNSKSGALVSSDFDLEKIFNGETNIELEIFPQRFLAIPIYELTSAVTLNKYSDDSPKIILPPPFKQTPPPPVLPNPIVSNGHYPRAPLLPKFQPLL